MITKKLSSNDILNEFDAANDDGRRPGEIATWLREEISELQPVVTAAVLVTAAFRLKDERGLVVALRRLATAVDVLETQRECD
ncbi:hypothetical protein SAMN07250955_103173 [Arboricoccus pini]|uniref:Uncharacterized protein n=1 Tax=Arboricoccus pini TaxID=1963835 RepID=A0A212QSZ5_9PROT|nr:hypothetical protein SAMN07250955_103173 [Arboricoccus pini]